MLLIDRVEKGLEVEERLKKIGLCNNIDQALARIRMQNKEHWDILCADDEKAKIFAVFVRSLLEVDGLNVKEAYTIGFFDGIQLAKDIESRDNGQRK